MHLSKSQYLRFKQCNKSIWLLKNNPEVRNTDKSINNILEKANRVGEVARALFPHGVQIEYNPDSLMEMVLQTKNSIDSGVKIIYEAAFLFDDIFVICDILHFNDNGWNIYEVKSSTKVKERHIDDSTIQYYVVKNSGLSINSINIIYINNEYEKDGELNINELFVVEDKTEEIEAKVGVVPEQLDELRKTIDGEKPEFDIGMYCEKYGKENFECDFKEHCWRHIPEYSVFNITRIGKRKFDLYDKGVVNMTEIPVDYHLSESQRFQVQSAIEGKDIINKEEIQNFLGEFSYPMYFLDYETFQQAIPEFDRLKPYQQIPFQYSLHILENENEELIHKEFLGKEGIDPRRELAEQIVKDIPKDICTIAYNMSFEKSVLRHLGELFEDLKDHLMNIHDNMVDLMVPFQKKWYYTNDMKGSYSIKYVLPALFPNSEELNYKGLSIQNGQMAMNIFETLHLKEIDQIEKIREDLLAYCKLDTLAMVRIWGKLNSI